MENSAGDAVPESEISLPSETPRTPLKIPSKRVMTMVAVVIVVVLLIAVLSLVQEEEKGGKGGAGEQVVIPDDYDETSSDSLQHGRALIAGGLPHPEGEGEGETYNLYPFPIEANITEIRIESSGDGGRQRWDGGDSNDLDLYLYREGNDAGGNFDSTNPTYAQESPYINELLTRNSLDIGNWTLRVECYTGDNVQYDIQIQVFYERETTDDNNGGD